MSHSFVIRTLSLGIALTLSTLSAQTAMAVGVSTCPFDGGGSDAINDGVVLTRYALGITGTPLVASTRYASLDPLQVKNNIECVGCALDMNGDGQIDTVDTTIIARHLTGFSGLSLTNGLALGAGSRSTSAAVTSFLVSGCAVGGAMNGWTLGGNAFGAPGVLGTTDAQPLRIQSGGSDLSLLFPSTQHGLRLSNVGNANVTGVNTINGAAVNSIATGVINATIAGGGVASTPTNLNPNLPNQVTGDAGTVGGGIGNTAATFAAIAGGQENQTSGAYAVVGGGYQNQAVGNATVAGGSLNLASGSRSFIGGGESNRATSDATVVAGGLTNVATGPRAFVGGGQGNRASGEFSSVVGGTFNEASGIGTSVFGGAGNIARGSYAAAGGYFAQALNQGSFVWADSLGAEFASTADDQFSVRATGGVRFVTATFPIGTPKRTVSIDLNGTLDFGSNTRQNINLWGGGTYGIGVQSGTQYFRADGSTVPGSTFGFSWHWGGTHSDSPNAPGAGGAELMRLSTNGNLQVRGSVSGGVILNISDRNVKSLIQSINPQAILAKVAAMPISRWVYTADEKKSWHLGPMAQDFRAAFGLGQDDKTIATVDVGGVALAAIQGLNTNVIAQMKAKDAEIASLRKAQAALMQKLAAIEKRLNR
jgi:trimeric autotransporter adhesin